MVMWMSRIERKRIEKKLKIHFKIYIFIIFVLLISGLIAVDFEVRSMLAIDEFGLIGYQQLENDQYIVHLIGKNYLVDTVILRTQVYNKFAEFREIAYNIREFLMEIFNRKL